MIVFVQTLSWRQRSIRSVGHGIRSDWHYVIRFSIWGNVRDCTSPTDHENSMTSRRSVAGRIIAIRTDRMGAHRHWSLMYLLWYFLRRVIVIMLNLRIFMTVGLSRRNKAVSWMKTVIDRMGSFCQGIAYSSRRCIWFQTRMTTDRQRISRS